MNRSQSHGVKGEGVLSLLFGTKDLNTRYLNNTPNLLNCTFYESKRSPWIFRKTLIENLFILI